MRILSLIMGILMIVFGVCCMCTPLMTYFGMNVFFVILVTVYGVFSIIGSIASKTYGVGLAFGIISVLLGILMLVFPQLIVLTDVIVMWVTAAWILLMSIYSIYQAIKVKKYSSTKGWIFLLIVGILGVLLGGYSIFHPLVFGMSLASVIGILIGCDFIVTGISMLLFRPREL